ncbi:MAG: plasmid recombination protein, partial [Phocaeicola sp.]
MKRTISIAKGKGSIGHNSREFKADNIDPSRVHFNTCYVNEDLQETYHKLFDNALESYNAKQKRNDRKIPDYYEKIRTSKQEKLFYEIIVQVGNFEDMHATSKNGKIAEEILHKYMTDFQKRNPTLYVFSAHLHMDEATPHLHIDFVPYSKGNKRGLETKNTLKGALNQLGFDGGTRGNTELNQWQDSEKEVVAKLMLEHGIEWEKKDIHKEHLTVLDYKKEQRTLEVNKLDEIIEEKTLRVNDLELKTEQADNVLSEKSDKLLKVENKLTSMLKNAKTIDNNVRNFDENPEWQLEEPSLLMTASAYKEKKATPLVFALKEYIHDLTLKFVQLKSAFDKQNKKIENLNNRLESTKARADKNDYGNTRYNLLEKIMG